MSFMVKSNDGPQGIDMSSSSPSHVDQEVEAPPRCTRYVRFASVATSVGCAADIASLVTTAVGVAIGVPAPLYAAIATNGLSAIEHGLQGCVTFKWAPERELEQNVIRLGKQVEALLRQNRLLQEASEDLGRTCKRFEQEAAAERASAEKAQAEAKCFAQNLQKSARALQTLQAAGAAATAADHERNEEELQQLGTVSAAIGGAVASHGAASAQTRKEIQEEIHDLERLCAGLRETFAQQKGEGGQLVHAAIEKIEQLKARTEQLEAVSQHLKKNQDLIQEWKRVLSRFSETISSLRPETFASDVGEMTRRLEQIGLSEQDFSKEVDKLDSAAAAIGEAGASFGTSIVKIQSVVTELATKITEKKKVVERLTAENERLDALVKRFEENMERVEKEDSSLRTLFSEERAAIGELRSLEALVQNPNFREIFSKVYRPMTSIFR